MLAPHLSTWLLLPSSPSLSTSQSQPSCYAREAAESERTSHNVWPRCYSLPEKQNKQSNKNNNKKNKSQKWKRQKSKRDRPRHEGRKARSSNEPTSRNMTGIFFFFFNSCLITSLSLEIYCSAQGALAMKDPGRFCSREQVQTGLEIETKSLKRTQNKNTDLFLCFILKSFA